ncbi:hypothetical protein VJ918_01140 [Adlercreutzia sp. R21]|nr:hypothetical protein [Adlercreutzia sp. R21]MEC4183408.1 hypothetical protein [Adlercreutzia sp. R21]
MATIDVDALREYLRDYYGTAMMSGLWPAVADLGGGGCHGRPRAV